MGTRSQQQRTDNKLCNNRSRQDLPVFPYYNCLHPSLCLPCPLELVYGWVPRIDSLHLAQKLFFLLNLIICRYIYLKLCSVHFKALRHSKEESMCSSSHTHAFLVLIITHLLRCEVTGVSLVDA